MAYPSPAQSDNSTHSVDYFMELFCDKKVIHVGNWDQTTGKPLIRDTHNKKILLYRNFKSLFPHLETIEEFYNSFPSLHSLDYIDLIHYNSLVKIFPNARHECICSQHNAYNFGIIYFADEPNTLYLIGRTCLNHFQDEDGNKLVDTSKKCHRCRNKLGRQSQQEKDRPICRNCIAREQQLICEEKNQRYHIEHEFESLLTNFRYQLEEPLRIAKAKFNDAVTHLIVEERQSRRGIQVEWITYLNELTAQENNLKINIRFKEKIAKRRQLLHGLGNMILESGVNKGKTFSDLYTNHKTFKPWLANKYPNYGKQYRDLYRYWLVRDNEPLPEETEGPGTVTLPDENGSYI